MKKKKFRNLCLAAVLGIAAFAGVCSYDAGAGTNIHIINVSYDPTRELYESYNKNSRCVCTASFCYKRKQSLYAGKQLGKRRLSGNLTILLVFPKTL